jgi:hypothetical protein
MWFAQEESVAQYDFQNPTLNDSKNPTLGLKKERMKPWNNDFMEKNADGKIEISMAAYNPYKASSQKSTWRRQLLGINISNMTPQ